MILELLEVEGFQKLFEKFLPKSKTKKEAYDRAEEVYASNFGKNKYSNYESFRKTRERFLNNN